MKSVGGWGEWRSEEDELRIKHVWSKAGSWERIEEAPRCGTLGSVCSRQTDVALKERRTSGGNGLMGGFDVTACKHVTRELREAQVMGERRFFFFFFKSPPPLETGITLSPHHCEPWPTGRFMTA